MQSEKPRLKPFVKWAGGKGQLLANIRQAYPNELGRGITKYAEPFVGGGAVLFDLLSTYEIGSIYISDINAELINTYKIIRDNVDLLILRLAEIQIDYLPMSTADRKQYYYNKRNTFNDLKINGHENVNVEKAALFIFLNRTCFNGLYRVNKQGLFNVPMGAYKNPSIYDENNLRNISTALKNVTIVCGDYRKSASFIDQSTFVYFDPPYRPLTETANFTSYTEQIFDDTAQTELAEFVSQMNNKGARFIVSNSDPKNANANDHFFDELYKRHRIKRVEATRMINCNGESRGKITELLISNFEGDHTNEEENVMLKPNREFAKWLSTFRPSIADYTYYADLQKVYKNVNSIKVELNILNSLIGSTSIEKDFLSLVCKYPEVLKCIPLLIAVRAHEIYAIDADGEFIYSFKKMNYSTTQYCEFMRKTGLFDLLQNHIINNLVDYVTGVETGLDSHGRKNRGGHLMENLVESYIVKSGFVKNVDYFKEMLINKIVDKWEIDLSAISNKGKTEKKFDFVIKTANMIYLIETNFYGSSGSKLNETARSYKTLSTEVDTIDQVTFVWFTDGNGWNNAKNNLEETFDIMEHIYNIHDMEKGIISKIFI